uniref:Oligosaccharyltransferase complex subunit n=1 Tax=Pongo abelii TaxID=9601 RepID=A0A8I5TVB5_PONAB
METLYRVPFLVLECPNLKLKKPPWLHMPSAMTVYALVVVSYFLITGALPSQGSKSNIFFKAKLLLFLLLAIRCLINVLGKSSLANSVSMLVV